jgi:alkaline phosphatase D
MEPTGEGPRRTFGVARIQPASSSRFRQPVFFKMNPNFDMTGVVMFDDLSPETGYVYQMGYIFSDLDLEDLGPDYPLDWSGIGHAIGRSIGPGTGAAEFRTGATDETRPRSFVFGSCRYLLRLFGGLWFDSRGDKTFRSILRQIDGGTQTDLLVMLGDQIYADDLNVIAPDETLDEYNARYRAAFSQPHIRELMSHVPTYMTLDEHEIEDAWPAHATTRDWMVKYPSAMHAYLTYQASHSPLMTMSGPNRMVGVPDKLWYTFSDGCCDFFATDTRTERYLSDDPDEREIVSPLQLEALKDWLADGSGRAKFVVTAVPFFPDTASLEDRADKWGGFVGQRTGVLDHIRCEGVKRVVFLAGDYHLSMKAELISPGAPDFKVLSVVSSPFFWPYPHRSWRKSLLSGPLASSSEHEYVVVNSSPLQATDNFTRVTTDLEGLSLSVFDRKGETLFSTEYAY